MTSWIWIALGGVGIVLIAMIFLRKPAARGAMAAARAGDVGPLVATIEASATSDRATRWDSAISELWSGYHREPAALLVVAAAERSDDDIVQYWIGQVLQVEPEIAQLTFSPEFLATHFRPDIASRCGRKGCCG